jgi:histidine triad (HIT) family protein
MTRRCSIGPIYRWRVMAIRVPEMDPCYFCAIVGGTSDRWSVVEQTDLTITVLNGRQFETGQSMVVPVRHAPTLLDLTGEEDAAIMAAARRLARAMVAAFDPDGILLYQNNGVGSLQEVPHFHLHVVPRHPGSDWGTGPPHLARLERRSPRFDHTVVDDVKRQTAETLRRALNDRDWMKAASRGGATD